MSEFSIVDIEVGGRTGIYNVVIDDITSLRSNFDVELEGDLVISYGDLQRRPIQQVLKSWVQLSFVDEGLELHKEFRGGFSPNKYRVEIRGPGVDWQGLVREESRTIPFSQRTQIERTVLNCYGGITEDRFSIPSTSLIDKEGARFDEVTLQAITFGDDEIIRSDVQILDQELNLIDLGTKNERPRPINVSRTESLYQGIIEYGKMTKAILYRSLSEGAIVYDSSRLIGTSGTSLIRTRSDRSGSGTGFADFSIYDNPPTLADFNQFQRDSKFVSIKDLVTGRENDGLRDLDRAGVIEVQFDKDGNLIQPGASNISSSDSSFVSWTPKNNSSVINLDFYHGNDITKFVKVVPDGIVQLFLGNLTPTGEVAVLITWEEVQGSPSVELKYRGNDGRTELVSDASTTDGIIGPMTEQRIDPLILIDGSGSDSINIKAQYIDSSQNIIETMIADSDNRGVDSIQIENIVPPLVQDSNGTDTREARATLIPSIGVGNNQPWLVRSSVERSYQPFGTQTARGRLYGVYGPETAFGITENTSSERIFLATGLKINLTTGITDFALVEAPNHAIT